MLLRILLPLLLLLSLPAWGIYRLSVRKCITNKRLAKLFFLPNAIIALLLICTCINESYSAVADHWKGLLLSVTILLIFPELLLILILGIARLLRRLSPKAEKVVSYLGWGFCTLCFCGILYGMTLGYRHIIIKEYTYANNNIPRGFDGYRIVQVSDLHLGTLSGHKEVVRAIVDSINACRADLVVFTGDIVNYHAEEMTPFMPILQNIRAHDGVIAIMGNHDYAQYYKWPSPADSLADIHRLQDNERHMGWDLLLNENRVLRRGTDSLAIVGVENDGRPPFPALADLPRAQKGLQDSCFKILLSHDPTHWRRNVIPETDIPLMLAGHTHGMQFKIGKFSPASWFYKEWGGEYVEGEQTLYISLGTGEVMLPFRLGAWPEINIITLKRQK